MNAAQAQQKAILSVQKERQRQDDKWGQQDHDDPLWLTILAEEFGEVARAMLDGTEQEVWEELRQTAAVAVAWLECISRRQP